MLAVAIAKTILVAIAMFSCPPSWIVVPSSRLARCQCYSPVAHSQAIPMHRQYLNTGDGNGLGMRLITKANLVPHFY